MSLELIIKKLFNVSTDNYIFIYTPPKVGSTTLVSSLRISLGKTYNVFHIHDEIMLNVLTGIKDIKINSIINYLSKIGKNVYVIDVYRTPIERKMSEFFEKISPYHFNNSEENIKNYSIKRITDRFNKIFPHIEKGDHYMDNYNIDQIIPFNYEKKYTIQEYNSVKYIKLRLCDSELWGNILSTILQTDIVLITDYTTETKIIGELYKEFKNEYRLPRNFFEEIKNCKILKFYYNDEERNKYLLFWGKRLCEEYVPYSQEEFEFYMRLCLENQYINDIHIEHYIDNGCFCNLCSKKRKNIYFSAKNGKKKFDKIIHHENVNKEIEKNKKNVKNLKDNNLTIKKKIIDDKFKIKLK
jgi:hypothetical protein